MAVNIEVRVSTRQVNEAMERARVLDRSITEAFTQLGQSAVAAGAALSIRGEASRFFMEAVAEAARQESDRILDRANEARYRTPVVWQGSRFELEYLGSHEREVQEEESDARARALLLSCLSPFQRHRFNTDEWFIVIAKSGRRYRIERGYNFNIVVLDEMDRAMGRLCAGPDESVPVYDSMLSQKLWLENDEEGFLRIANRDGWFIEPPDYFDHPVLGPIRRRQRIL